MALDEVPEELAVETLFIGELGLNGQVIGVQGTLPIVAKAKEMGIKTCFVPRDNFKEACLIKGIEIIGVRHLKELISGTFYSQEGLLVKTRQKKEQKEEDFKDVHGQKVAKRCLEIAASGGHNLLLIGPPGSGKTMLAKRVPGIMPTLLEEESIELTKIYSIYGLLDGETPLQKKPPFREVHHAITKSALIGGGLYPKPGEITFAHKGILFLDEITEFNRSVLESLREPLEEKKIRISRQHQYYEFPADFILIGACNPCPCGMYPDRNLCNCKVQDIKNYRAKISGAFLDRMDLSIQLGKLSYQEVTNEGEAESSSEIRKRVNRTKKIQEERYGYKSMKNSLLLSTELAKHCALDEEGKSVLEKAYNYLNLTARGYHKILKVSRTIADMEQKEKIEAAHVKEALAYRIKPNWE